MGLLDDLQRGLDAVQRTLGALGPRPEGSPADLRSLASQLRAEVDAVNGAGRVARGIPGTLVFKGPAATRFRGHAGEVGESLFTIGRRLDGVIADLRSAANRIEQAQKEHDRNRASLESQVSEFVNRIRSAGS